MCRECQECFLCHRLQRKPLLSGPGMHHGTCVTHVPWCLSEPLTRKRSRISRRMHNPQFYVSGKRPMEGAGCSEIFTVLCWPLQRHHISIRLSHITRNSTVRLKYKATHRWPFVGNPPTGSQHKGPVMRQMFPCHDIIISMLKPILN